MVADTQTNMKSRLTRFAYVASRLTTLVQSAVADLLAVWQAGRAVRGAEPGLVPIPVRVSPYPVRRRLHR